MDRTLGLRYAQYLETLPVTTLRTLGQKKGVPRPSTLVKENLIDALVAVLTGVVPPAPPTLRGAPVKQTYLSPEIEARLEQIRRDFAPDLVVHSPDGVDEPYAYDERVLRGILEILPSGGGLLRDRYCRAGVTDIFVPAVMIERYELREGDMVATSVVDENGTPTMRTLYSVNERATTTGASGRNQFETLSATFPQERYQLALGNQAFAVLDLFAPIGKGQRVLLSYDGAEDRNLTIKMAKALNGAYERQIRIVLLLVNRRPEEISHAKRDLDGDVELIYTTFDDDADAHLRACKLALARVKRLAEEKRDVVLFTDAVPRIARVDGECLLYAKKLFGTARAIEEGGSVTAFAMMPEQSALYEEFSDGANARLAFSAEWTSKGVFPPLDLVKSSTDGCEMLLSNEEKALREQMRAEGWNLEEIIRKL